MIYKAVTNMQYFSKSKETCAHLWFRFLSTEKQCSSAPKLQGVHPTQNPIPARLTI